jgi:Co/Zn/Cd efflux system component
LEIAPAGLDVELIERDLKRTFPELAELFNSHLWAITPSMLVFSAHLKVTPATDPKEMPKLLTRINVHLAAQFGIIESTLQVAAEEEPEVCNVPLPSSR